MKRIISFLLLLVVLAVGYFLVAPALFDRRVSEDFPQSKKVASSPLAGGAAESPASKSDNSGQLIAQGEITGQSNHRAEGTASLLQIDGKYFIRLEDDFDAQNGPDLFVHLGREGKYDPQINLGKLKGNIGSQNYAVPDSIKITEYSEVWIWCRVFSVPFARAVLIPIP